MWNILNTIAGCVCIYLLVYWVLEFRRARKKLEELEEELQKRSSNCEIFVDKLRDRFENNVKYTTWAIKDCNEKLEEHSKMIEALKGDMGKVITRTDSISKAAAYWGTNPASLPLKEHKQLIKDVAQIKSELELMRAIINHGSEAPKVRKRKTYLDNPEKVVNPERS